MKRKISINFNSISQIEGINNRNEHTGNPYRYTKIKIKKGGLRVGKYGFFPTERGAALRVVNGIIKSKGKTHEEGIYLFKKADKKLDPVEQFEVAKEITVPKGKRLLMTRAIMRGGWQSNEGYNGSKGLNYFVAGAPSLQGSEFKKYRSKFKKKSKSGDYKTWQDFRNKQIIGLKFTWTK